MTKRQRSKSFSGSALLAMDALSWTFTVLPACAAWSAAGAVLYKAWSGQGAELILAALLVPAVASLVMIAAAGFLRLFLPRLREGVYTVGLNRMTVTWFAHLALSRSVRAAGLWPVISSSHALKFLYFRAMGAKISFGVNTALDISLTDLPLISIGQGVTLAENTHVSAHSFTGSRLVLKRVKLGKNSFVGMDCYLGPGTELGEGAWIGAGNRISGQALAPGSRLVDKS